MNRGRGQGELGDTADVLRTEDIPLRRTDLSGRDSLHVAAVERYGVERILSVDRGFDRYPGVVRIS